MSARQPGVPGIPGNFSEIAPWSRTRPQYFTTAPRGNPLAGLLGALGGGGTTAPPGSRFGPGSRPPLGGPVPPFPPGGGGGAGYTTGAPANPFLEKAFGYFEDLWNRSKELEGETYNKEPAIQDYQRMRAQGLKELQAGAGGRGFGPGTGMSLASMQSYGQGTEQGAQGLSENLWNAGLNQRTALLQNMAGILGGLGGVGGNIAQNQLGLSNLGLQGMQLGSENWWRQQQLELERERAGRDAQLEAFRTIAPYLMSVA